MLRMVIQISFLAKDRQQCRTFQSVDLRQDGISLMISCALRALELHSHLPEHAQEYLLAVFSVLSIVQSKPENCLSPLQYVA